MGKLAVCNRWFGNLSWARDWEGGQDDGRKGRGSLADEKDKRMAVSSTSVGICVLSLCTWNYFQYRQQEASIFFSFALEPLQYREHRVQVEIVVADEGGLKSS